MEENYVVCYTQVPRIVLYGLPEYTVQEKWVLTALMGLCWDRKGNTVSLKELEGPYKLSLREIAALAQVDHTTLRSKGKKNVRKGILDHWQEIGYITVVDAQPVDELTGKKGRAQTYLYIHLEKIWLDNIAFSEKWKIPNKLIDPYAAITVDVADSSNEENTANTVGHANTNVGYANSHVDVANDIVGAANLTVGSVSTNSGQEDKEELTQKEEREKLLPSLSQNLKFISPLVKKQCRTLGMSPELEEENIQRVTNWYIRSGVNKENLRYTINSAMEETRRKYEDRMQSQDARFYFFNDLRDRLKMLAVAQEV